mgnify:CR=1 FL=1
MAPSLNSILKVGSSASAADDADAIHSPARAAMIHPRADIGSVRAFLAGSGVDKIVVDGEWLEPLADAGLLVDVTAEMRVHIG